MPTPAHLPYFNALKTYLQLHVLINIWILAMSNNNKMYILFLSQIHLLIEADSWFPRKRNMLLGYLILYASNRQIVSNDFFPLNSVINVIIPKIIFEINWGEFT